MKRALKILLIVIAAIIIVPLVTALFVKKDYSVEKEVTINRPLEEVFDYLVLLRNQDNFSVWMDMDPEVRQDFRGTDGTVGFVSAWESDDKNVGSGEQEITAIIPYQRIEYELRFIEPFESVSQAYMTTETVSDDQTLVKWGFTGRMNYPMNLMLLAMDFEGMIGSDLQKGLENLKEILE
ncbi:MAG: polyketide cyclase [Bacteroidetes bacterium]|nr:MAG: polyketide cyclase [Bacteroidota bacterium]